MANKVLAFLEKADHAIEVVAVDIIKGADDAVKLLADVKNLSPAAKTGIQLLIADAEALATTAVSAGSVDGLDFAKDNASVLAAKKLITDFLALLPVLKADAKVLIADVKTQ